MSDAALARQMLGSISRIVLTLAGIVFSVTLVAISMASSQFGSRLLRSFMSDHLSDRVVGLLFGTSLFCFIIGYHVKGSGGGRSLFIPQYSIAGAAALGLFSIATLIWFIHQTAMGLQAPRLVARVAEDLNDAVERLLPDKIESSCTKRHTGDSAVLKSGYLKQTPVQMCCDGYVEGVDFDSLIAVAMEMRGLTMVQTRPGAFVCGHTEIAIVYSDNSEEEGPSFEAIRSAFVVGPRRTPRQDISCSMIELVEIATRALSPGINNPFAATNCIDRLSAALSRLARRTFPDSAYVDEHETVRVLQDPFRFTDLFSDSFSLIRQHGAKSVAVAIRLVEAFDRFATQVQSVEDMFAIRQQADALRSDFLDAIPADIDQQDFERRFQHLQGFWCPAGYP